MKKSKNVKKPNTFGLGLTFIPLSFAAGLTNDKPWIGLFIGIVVAGIIEWIRYRRLKNN